MLNENSQAPEQSLEQVAAHGIHDSAEIHLIGFFEYILDPFGAEPSMVQGISGHRDRGRVSAAHAGQCRNPSGMGKLHVQGDGRGILGSQIQGLIVFNLGQHGPIMRCRKLNAFQF